MQPHVLICGTDHHVFAEAICELIASAAAARGTGIATRQPEYIRKKMSDGHAVIAIDRDKVAGFCYIESWENKRYVANSGLIVHPDYRQTGLAKAIKQKAFELSKKHFPDAILFGITTSLPVMKINSELGYKPVAFSELTKDDNFWKGCQGCKNHDILERTNRSMCLCTAMVCDLSKVRPPATEKGKQKAWEAFRQFLKDPKSGFKRMNGPYKTPVHEK